MANRKNHNSVIFLATLGVYFGLVLVGSTPQVLAQQTATIKYHRTLPGADLYADSVVKLTKELNQLSAKRKFDWNKTAKYSLEDISFGKDNDWSASMGFGSLDSELQFIVENSGYDIARRLFSRKADSSIGPFNSRWPDTINFEFLSENQLLKLTVKINTESEQSAQILGNSVNDYLSKLKTSSKSSAQELVAENIKSKVENAYVFLLSQLPRADLETLLAKDAK